MPKYTYDKKIKKVVKNPNYVAVSAEPKWDKPWSQATEENWAGDIKDLYEAYGFPMGDRQPDDPPPLIEMTHILPPDPDLPSYKVPASKLKFQEDRYLEEVSDYIIHTYGEHYAQGNVQTFELIASSGHADGFTMGNIMKLASRYGKKEGYNRKDILKIIHYAILQLWIHDNRKIKENLNNVVQK